MSDDGGVGKKAEAKIKLWLDKPEEGYCFDRLPDQMTGFYGSKNICDFTLFKSPYFYYIESKATWEDRWDFANLTDVQRTGLYKKSQIQCVYGLVIVLYASYQRAFILDIRDIVSCLDQSIKSINIKKLDQWKLPYIEVPTINSRKKLLDYDGAFEDLVQSLMQYRNSGDAPNIVTKPVIKPKKTKALKEDIHNDQLSILDIGGAF